jgi:type I restriction enzyme M protein
MTQLENIEAIEKRLWNAADNLRANSNYASNEYFMPVMGLIFLRHAYSRFLMVKDSIAAGLPQRAGKTRELTKQDFSQKSSIFLRPNAQFDYLVSLPSEADRADAIIKAMESIEEDYATLKGVLPKAEYQELDNEVLGQLLRTLNPDELKRVSGDVFGRIYEYFLTQFADQKAHDGGEFFTPVSLVSLIANVLEPKSGQVLDPACGSGGMFVQSARFVEQLHANPAERLTFYGLEKNPTTIRLAKMNLAVHGLEGDIQKAISYYEDPHELFGKADFVMANPPFNVDEVDADKVKNDPRLPFGLPGVNNKGKVSNGNYLWISYFYSYLNAKGRAGFVMSSQASSAGRDEAKVRQKLIESEAVEAMIAIRSNFFYTRTVPCELWFLNRDKPKKHKGKILMIDARNVYRKVTRKIYDFSPEQLQNLLSIVWLYRGEDRRFLNLVAGYLTRTLTEAQACFNDDSLPAFIRDLTGFYKTLGEQVDVDLKPVRSFEDDIAAFRKAIDKEAAQWAKQTKPSAADLVKATERLAPLTETARDLIRDADLLYKQASRLMDERSATSPDVAANGNSPKLGDVGVRQIRASLKNIEESRKAATEGLKQVRYFHRQAHWLTERFPAGELCDVPGLVKLVDVTEMGEDYSLTPGRYVGIAPEEVDEDFDFEAALHDIHVELGGLNAEAAELAAKIAKNFEELGA